MQAAGDAARSGLAELWQPIRIGFYQDDARSSQAIRAIAPHRQCGSAGVAEQEVLSPDQLRAQPAQLAVQETLCRRHYNRHITRVTLEVAAESRWVVSLLVNDDVNQDWKLSRGASL